MTVTIEPWRVRQALRNIGTSSLGASELRNSKASERCSTSSPSAPAYTLSRLHRRNFFALSVENKPFGDGPWPCLNPVCNQYRQLCIRECRIVHSQNVSGKPIGTFVCTCGFAYSRTGSDATGNNQFQLNRTKAFGTLWGKRLETLRSTRSRTQTGRQFTGSYS